MCPLGRRAPFAAESVLHCRARQLPAVAAQPDLTREVKDSRQATSPRQEHVPAISSLLPSRSIARRLRQALVNCLHKMVRRPRSVAAAIAAVVIERGAL